MITFFNVETSGFVEQLFRSLDSESYLKGVDPPSNAKSVPVETGKRAQTNDNKTSSTSTPPAPIGDRRQSEDQGRRNEVLYCMWTLICTCTCIQCIVFKS